MAADAEAAPAPAPAPSGGAAADPPADQAAAPERKEREDLTLVPVDESLLTRVGFALRRPRAAAPRARASAAAARGGPAPRAARRSQHGRPQQLRCTAPRPPHRQQPEAPTWR